MTPLNASLLTLNPGVSHDVRRVLKALCLLVCCLGCDTFASTPPRPQLQVINGSAQPVDVFWIKSDQERKPNGSVMPGKSTFITTTFGHRFVLIGQRDKAELVVTSTVPVQAVRFDPPDKEGVPAFYTQRISAEGYPIVASAKVSPYALKEAAYLVNLMLAKRPDVRSAMIKSGSRLCILAWNEFTTDQPEWQWLTNTPVPEFPGISARDYRDARARGMGGSLTDPYCSCTEENLLGYPGDPYAAECILIHEFAHNIHLRGMANVDPTFDVRVKAAYDAATKKGLWKGKYAGVNHHEYFAEGVQTWFDNNRFNDHDHNHVHLRSQLIEYDPGLAALCREVFGDTELKYTKPATRLAGHLAGYNPSQAPTFVWPERLRQAKALIKQQALARDEAANGHSSHGEGETRSIAGWTVHVSNALLATNTPETKRALALLTAQLEGIVRNVPPPAVAELQKVPLWISPEYPGVRPRAEYHPSDDWLRKHGRNPAMAKGVEFTNVRIFEKETQRMPVFALHELAHAYHDRALPGGNGNPEIKAAYEKAKASGKYEHVEQRFGDGRTANGRAYAMNNPQEYFAEATEAFFGTNDFLPFTRSELKQHDPEMFALLEKVWNLAPPNLTPSNTPASW